MTPVWPRKYGRRKHLCQLHHTFTATRPTEAIFWPNELGTARAEGLGMSFRGISTCSKLDHASASHATNEGRAVNVLDARDRKIIATVIRALQRLLEEDDVRPALHEEQQARIVIQGDKVLLLAALSAHAMLTNAKQHRAPIHRMPPLQQRARRAFAFG